MTDTTIWQAPPPPSVTRLSAQAIGNPGRAIYFYWIVAHYPVGSVISQSFQLRAAPSPTTPLNSVFVSWEPLLGVVTYDLLRTDTNVLPVSTVAHVALATGLTTTEFIDAGQPLQAYDLVGLPYGAPVDGWVRLNNRDYIEPVLQLSPAVQISQIIFPDGTIQDTAGIPGPDAPEDGETYGRDDGAWTRVVAVAGDTMTGALEIRMTNPPGPDDFGFVVGNSVSGVQILLEIGTDGSQMVLDGGFGTTRDIRMRYDGVDRWVWQSDDTGQTLQLTAANPDREVLTFDWISGLGTVVGEPTDNLGIATKSYVDSNIAQANLWQGTYQVSTNTPDLSTINPLNGYSWTAVDVNPNVPEPLLVDLPPIPAGTLIHNSDLLIYSTSIGWSQIVGASLTKTQADSFYVQKTGDTMSGPLYIALTNPPGPDDAGFVVGNTASLTSIQLLIGTSGSAIVLGSATGPPRSIQIGYDGTTLWAWQADGVGDTFQLLAYNPNQTVLGFTRATGLGTVAGDPTEDLGIATKQYVDTRAFGADAPIDGFDYGRKNGTWVRCVQLAGDTMTGPLTMANGNYAGSPTSTGYSFQFITLGGGRPQWITSNTDVGGGAGLAGEAIQFWTNDHISGIFPNNAVWCGKFSNGQLLLPIGSAAAPALALGGNALWSSGRTNSGLYSDSSGSILFTVAGTALGVFPSAPGSALVLSGGIAFGSAVAPGGPLDLTRHIRLWAQSPGTSGFGFSITSGQLNYVVSATNNIHAFVNPAGGANWATISGLGFTVIENVYTTQDGRGYWFFSDQSGGGIYKAVGAGIVIRQNSGNSQPQIENNNGSNRREILDATTTQNIPGQKTFTGNDVRLFFNSGSTATVSTRLAWQSSRVGRDPYMATISCRSSGYSYYGEVTQMLVQLEMGGYGTQNWLWNTPGPATNIALNVSGAVNANAAYVAPSEERFKTNVSDVADEECGRALSGIRLKRFQRRPPAPLGAFPETLSPPQYGLLAEEIEASCPEAVADLSDPDGNAYKGYSLDQIVALLVGQTNRLARAEDARIAKAAIPAWPIRAWMSLVGMVMRVFE